MKKDSVLFEKDSGHQESRREGRVKERTAQ